MVSVVGKIHLAGKEGRNHYLTNNQTMNYPVKVGRVFYAAALIVYGLQQFYFGSFRNVFVSAYQKQLPFPGFFAILFGAYLLVTAIMIVWDWKGQESALILGGILFVLFISTQLTYQFFTEPNKLYHLGLWTNQLKELALCGGAFVVSGSFEPKKRSEGAFRLLEKIAPYGNLFFLFTMICFGLCHLVYASFLMTTIPDWWPDHLFWVNATGVALISSGIAIALGIRIRVVALLQSLMIFLWFWMMHLPAAIHNPTLDRGNLLASAFDALAFSGTGLLIAFTMKVQAWVQAIESWNYAETKSDLLTISIDEKSLQY